MHKRLLVIVFVLMLNTLYAQQPQLMLPIGHNGNINYVEFSKDGKKSATASDDKTAKIWDVESGRLLGELKGHNDRVTKIHFSPDGTRLITFTSKDGNDRVTRIWDARTFKLIKVLPEPAEYFSNDYDPTFSANKKWIVTVDGTKVYLWDAMSGKPVTSVVASSDSSSLTSARFSADGRKIVCASDDLEVTVWRIDTTNAKGLVVLKKLNTLVGLRDFNGSFESNPDFLRRARPEAFFSSNGKYIVTMRGVNNFVQVSDAYTGKWIADLNGHKDCINAVSINRDITLFATASKDGTAKLWDSTGKLIYTLDQKEIQTEVDKIEVTQVYFSPDGQQLLVLSSASNHTSRAKIWDTETGRLLRTLDSATSINNAAFNFNGSKLILAVNNNVSHDQKAVIHNLKTPGSITVLGGHTGSLDNMELSKDGSKLFTYSPEKNSASIWNTEESKILITIMFDADKSADLFSKPVMHFNNDASMLIYTLNHDVRVYSTKSGLIISRFLINDETISDFNIMPDQQKIIALTYKINIDQKKVIIRVAEWEIATGKHIRTIYDFFEPYYLKGENHFRYNLPQFSRDSTMLLDFRRLDVNLKIRDVQNGRIINTFSCIRGSYIESAHFSPDNKKIIIATTGWHGDRNDCEVNIWDIASAMITTKRNDSKFDEIKDAFFMPDSNRVLTVYEHDSAQLIWDGRTGAPLLKINSKQVVKVIASQNGNRVVIVSSSPSYLSDRLELWDTDKGNLIKIMEVHSGSINSVLFTPNNDYIITTSADKTLKKWNAQTGDLIFTSFIIDSTDYLVLDKEGRYDGSEAARKSLYFMCNDEMIDLEQFEKLCWEPGLVSKLQGLNKEPISAKKLSDISICNFTPEVEQKGLINGNYNYVINERNGGIGEIQLFINGKWIRSFQPGSLIKNGLHKYLLTVPAKELNRHFPTGVANRITVKATTKDNSMTSRGGDGDGPILEKKKGNPNMYIVSIGINDYKGKGLKLRYASTDAENFAAVLFPAAQKLLNTDSVQHIKNYVFSTETANPNKPFKLAIKERLAKIASESTADDIFVFFFAGHGVLQGAEKKFYLLTADAAAFNLNGVEKEVAISFDELSEWMRNIVANKQVLIMDACNSGEAVEAQQLMGKREIPADLARAQENLRDQTGTYILAASASGRPAFEASQFGQGLLTYSLLNAIKSEEAIQGNGFLGISKWFTTAARNVSELAREVGERQDPKIIGNQGFDIGLVDGALLNSIHLSSRKFIFKKSTFMQSDLMIDNINLSNTIDSILNVNSSMGKESKLTYVESYKSADAFSIRGNYIVDNDKITIKISLIQGEKLTGYHIVKTGTIYHLAELSTVITEEVIAYLKNKN